MPMDAATTLAIVSCLLVANFVVVSVALSYLRARDANADAQDDGASKLDGTSAGRRAGGATGATGAHTADADTADLERALYADLLDHAAWQRSVEDEDLRVRRYGRPATLVVIELDGLDRLVARLGDGVADTLLPPIAEAIRREARASDKIVQLDHGRWGVLLPETDEIAAINFTERVRRTCDVWLAAGAVAVRTVIGWASPAGGQRLLDALTVAADRMEADRRRGVAFGADGFDMFVPTSAPRPMPAPDQR